MKRKCLTVSSLALLAGMTAACGTSSMVRSSQGALTPGKGERFYVSYPLAITQLKVTLGPAAEAEAPAPEAETPPAADAAGTAGAATPAAAGDAAAAPAVTPPAKKPAAKTAKTATPATTPAAGPPASDNCQALKKAYSTKADEQTAGLLAYQADLAKLYALALGPPGTLDSLKEQTAARTLDKSLDAQVKLADLRAAQGAALVQAYRDANCVKPFVLSFATKAVPSPDNVVALYVKDDGYSSDKIDIKFDDQGLPTMVSSSAADQSGEALTQAFKTVGAVAGLANPSLGGVAVGGAASVVGADLNPPHRVANKLVAEPEIAFSIALKARADAYLATKLRTLPALEPRAPAQPYVININSPDLLNAGASAWVEMFPGQGYWLQVSCATPPAAGGGGSGATGFLVSRPRGCTAWVRRVDPTAPAAAAPAGPPVGSDARVAFLALDPRDPQALPLMRTRQVTRVQKYELKDGQVQSVAYDKPSDAAAGWTLVPKLVPAAISGISESIRGQKGLVDDRKELLASQKAQITSQQELLKAQQDLIQARKDAKKPPAKEEPAPAPAS
ncbi:hypothetical protein QO010_000270 [Caulobacter ginsengisoli]|uniref:DUF4852 domain-containing protein n=1 Tax=Caulobacter ginsengisoli TaxID=400775 RepID=A0ABU0IKH8_9CAUL|nr:hypothetical protein [Caulobacter ginsengisoli]MDQ0462522.1 hypothetical protein [Caulobacter ginsengisoli]